MRRREFIQAAAVAGAGLVLGQSLAAPGTLRGRGRQPVDHRKLPRWRGFNLLEKFTLAGNRPFREEDFDIIARWGFDFVRLPMDYRCWTDPDDPKRLRENVLKEIDQAVEYGRKRGIHVSINFHRAPGYCVNPPREPLDLWTQKEALDLCCYHWRHFASRYKGIPSSALSFNLLNEPGDIPTDAYVKVATALVEAIRSEDPNRLVIADGLRWGRKPVPELASLGIAQSTRGYDPMQISHYKASWIGGSDRWPEPTWPLGGESGWNRDRLKRELIDPWKEIESKGVGVHVGEWGAFQHTPHKVVLAWMKDLLGLWKEAGWGWALWNLRGSFGVLDSGRADVQYEKLGEHQLDRQMLELLRAN
ncbi:MAG: glycoside hydrolase family 5 protein [Armatimonadota bacterium]